MTCEKTSAKPIVLVSPRLESNGPLRPRSLNYAKAVKSAEPTIGWQQVRMAAMMDRIRWMCCVVLSALVICMAAHAKEKEATMKHVKVYYEPGRFGGWPANHGIWSWDSEILVGFSREIGRASCRERVCHCV